jgi:hypothetical protein
MSCALRGTFRYVSLGRERETWKSESFHLKAKEKLWTVLQRKDVE